METDHQEPEYNQEEINTVIAAAHALNLDAPITSYRIVGNRIELWTCHGGPFIYPPSKPTSKPRPRTAKKSEKPAAKTPASKRKQTK